MARKRSANTLPDELKKRRMHDPQRIEFALPRSLFLLLGRALFEREAAALHVLLLLNEKNLTTAAMQ